LVAIAARARGSWGPQVRLTVFEDGLEPVPTCSSTHLQHDSSSGLGHIGPRVILAAPALHAVLQQILLQISVTGVEPLTSRFTVTSRRPRAIARALEQYLPQWASRAF